MQPPRIRHASVALLTKRRKYNILCLMTQNPAPSRIVSVAEAATRLNVRTVTVQRWIRAGKLPAIKLPGRTGAYVIDSDALDALAASRNAA